MNANLNLKKISKGTRCPFKVKWVPIALIAMTKTNPKKGYEHAKMKFEEKKIKLYI